MQYVLGLCTRVVGAEQQRKKSIKMQPSLLLLFVLTIIFIVDRPIDCKSLPLEQRQHHQREEEEGTKERWLYVSPILYKKSNFVSNGQSMVCYLFLLYPYKRLTK